MLEKKLEEVLVGMLSEKQSTSCFEMSIDFRQLRAVYICGAGENFCTCKCYSPNLLGGCSFLSANGVCLNTIVPIH